MRKQPNYVYVVAAIIIAISFALMALAQFGLLGSHYP